MRALTSYAWAKGFQRSLGFVLFVHRPPAPGKGVRRAECVILCISKLKTTQLPGRTPLPGAGGRCAKRTKTPLPTNPSPNTWTTSPQTKTAQPLHEIGRFLFFINQRRHKIKLCGTPHMREVKLRGTLLHRLQRQKLLHPRIIASVQPFKIVFFKSHSEAVDVSF